MKREFGLLTILSFALSLTVGCEGTATTAGIDGGGNRNPITVQGPIQGFGSIIVNDVHYDLSDATISVNGVPATETELALGQHVMLVGTIEAAGHASADSVVFEANVQGAVQSVDLALGRIVVLGQTVTTDDATVFDFGADAPALSSVSLGEALRISGYGGAGSIIHATRIERQADPEALRVIGTVANVDTTALRFDIGDLAIDYSSVQLLEGFPAGEPRNGDRVLAEGDALASDGALSAARIRLLETGFGASSGQAEVEGLITRFASPVDFDVSGLPITTTAATDYEGGDESNLLLNVKVQVEGRTDASGLIVATKIEIKDGGRVVGN